MSSSYFFFHNNLWVSASFLYVLNLNFQKKLSSQPEQGWGDEGKFGQPIEWRSLGQIPILGP